MCIASTTHRIFQEEMRVTKMLLRSPQKASSSSSSNEDSESRTPPSTSRAATTRGLQSSRVKRSSSSSKPSHYRQNILTRSCSKRLRRRTQHRHILYDIRIKRGNGRNGNTSKSSGRGMVVSSTKDEEHSKLSEDDEEEEEVGESDGSVLDHARSETAVDVDAIKENDNDDDDGDCNANDLLEEWIDQVAVEYDIVRDLYENIVATQGVVSILYFLKLWRGLLRKIERQLFLYF